MALATAIMVATGMGMERGSLKLFLMELFEDWSGR